jgi:hypothetical protein
MLVLFELFYMPVNKNANLEILVVFGYLNQKLWVISDADLLVLERSRIGEDGPTTVEFSVVAVDRRIPVNINAFNRGAQPRPLYLIYVG